VSAAWNFSSWFVYLLHHRVRFWQFVVIVGVSSLSDRVHRPRPAARLLRSSSCSCAYRSTASTLFVLVTPRTGGPSRQFEFFSLKSKTPVPCYVQFPVFSSKIQFS
jgi:hypothetical protein